MLSCCTANAVAPTVDAMESAEESKTESTESQQGFSVKKGRKEGRFVVKTDGSGTSKVTASGHTVTEDFNGISAPGASGNSHQCAALQESLWAESTVLPQARRRRGEPPRQ